MAASVEMISRLRRMVNESGSETYADADIQAAIERYPLTDALGEDPTVRNYATTPPVLSANPYWTATYDLNAAASDIWSEKAAILAQDFDFQADGASYTRSQAYEQAMKQARYYRSRRSPGVVLLRPEPAYRPSASNASYE